MRSILVTSLLLGSFLSIAQERLFVWEQNIAVNYDHKKWDFNTTLGGRTTKEESVEEVKNSSLSFLEINQFATTEVSSNKKLSIGYKYRVLEPQEKENLDEHRFTQQLAWTHSEEHKRVRLLSRFRLEQRVKTESFEHRYRYRFSADAPLNGEKLNVGEFYGVLSNELLYSSEEGDSSLDNRVTIGLGVRISQIAKFQTDFTYRSENFSGDIENVPFLTTSLIFDFRD
ncbi:MAG: DUF2490 domain-containing protein [Bacteroidota bacterium]